MCCKTKTQLSQNVWATKWETAPSNMFAQRRFRSFKLYEQESEKKHCRTCSPNEDSHHLKCMSKKVRKSTFKHVRPTKIQIIQNVWATKWEKAPLNMFDQQKFRLFKMYEQQSEKRHLQTCSPNEDSDHSNCMSKKVRKNTVEHVCPTKNQIIQTVWARKWEKTLSNMFAQRRFRSFKLYEQESEKKHCRTCLPNEGSHHLKCMSKKVRKSTFKHVRPTKIQIIQHVWATKWETLPSIMFAKRRLRSFKMYEQESGKEHLQTCSPNEDSDQSKCMSNKVRNGTFKHVRPTKIQISKMYEQESGKEHLQTCSPNEDSDQSKCMSKKVGKSTFKHVRPTKIQISQNVWAKEHLQTCSPNEDSDQSKCMSKKVGKSTFKHVRPTKIQISQNVWARKWEKAPSNMFAQRRFRSVKMYEQESGKKHLQTCSPNEDSDQSKCMSKKVGKSTFKHVRPTKIQISQNVWARKWEKAPSNMFAQRRFRSVKMYEQESGKEHLQTCSPNEDSDQSKCMSKKVGKSTFKHVRPTKIQISQNVWARKWEKAPSNMFAQRRFRSVKMYEQ